jgi:hypothetical protein
MPLRIKLILMCDLLALAATVAVVAYLFWAT